MTQFLRCASCEQELAVPDHLVGSTVVCQRCGGLNDCGSQSEALPPATNGHLYPAVWTAVGGAIVAIIMLVVFLWLDNRDKPAAPPVGAPNSVTAKAEQKPNQSDSKPADPGIDYWMKQVERIRAEVEAEQSQPDTIGSPTPAIAPSPNSREAANPDATPTELSAEDLYARVSPSVVTIVVKNGIGDEIGSGSGFVVQFETSPVLESVVRNAGISSQIGYLLTNYHVIRAAVDADISLRDGAQGKVMLVINDDEALDLALLCAFVDSKTPLITLPVSDSMPPVGRTVYAIGSPAGLSNSLSEGIVSGIREMDPSVTWLQTTAPISPGSSGGPLLTPDGKVVGVATSAFKEGQNLNFAVPAQAIVSFLAKASKPRELWRGASISRERATAYETLRPLIANGDQVALALLQADRNLVNNEADRNLVNNEPEKAIQAANEVMKSIPQELEYLVYFTLGRAQALLARRDLDRVPSKSLEDLEEKLLAHRNNKHLDESIRCFNKAVQLNPSFAPAYKYLASEHSSVGELSQGLSAANSLVRAAPRSIEAYSWRASFYSSLKKHDSAVEDLEVAAGLDPRDYIIQSNLGQEYVSLSQYDKAVEAYENALRLGHTNAHICHHNIGMALYKAGKYAEAISAFESSLRFVSGDDPTTRRSAEFIANKMIRNCRAKLRGTRPD